MDINLMNLLVHLLRKGFSRIFPMMFICLFNVMSVSECHQMEKQKQNIHLWCKLLVFYFIFFMSVHFIIPTDHYELDW